MKIYLKWCLFVFGPFLLIVGGVVWYMMRDSDRLSRDELDKSYNEDQVQRLQVEAAEKRFLDEQYRKANQPKTR